jgi:hypothetical protein
VWPAALRDRSRELEREHRIAARRRVGAGERRARNAHVEARANELVKRPGAKCPELDFVDPLVEGLAEIERISSVASLGGEDPDRRLAEPSDGEGDEGLRLWVEPLDVVDGDEHRLASSQHVEQGDECPRQRDRVGGNATRRLETDSDGERGPLSVGQLVGGVGQRFVDEVADLRARTASLPRRNGCSES